MKLFAMQYISHPFIKPETVESKLYQEVLAARVLEKGNSLVVAPTALGKTVVAVLVAADVIKNGGKVLFLAPTKPLAVQHEKSMKKFLNVPEEEIITMTGAVSPGKRRKIFETAKLISATPQSIQNDLVSGEISLKDFGLVVFDEAHRAIGDYSYVFIAEQYMKQAPNPLILALTASPGGEEEKIQSVCRNLFIKNVEIKTHEDEDVKDYVNKINVEWVKVDLPPKFLEVKVLLERFQKEQIDAVKKMGLGIGKRYFSRKDMLILQAKVRSELISNGSRSPHLYAAASKIAALLKVAHALTLLETQGIEPLVEYFDKMLYEAEKKSSKAVVTVMASDNILRAKKLVGELAEEKQVHPKLEALKRILVDQFIKKPESKVIVFNHYRANILSIADYLDGIDLIRAKRFVGQATKGEDKGLSQKEQVEIIAELRDGTHNCLIASSVAEEGLDIPEVDLVVFYEPVPSEIRTIQRRGRTGRKGEGKVIILMARNTRDEAFYYAGRAKERKMHATLKQLQEPNAIPEKSAEWHHAPQGENGKRLDQQMTLDSFVQQNADKVIIYADTREQASGVILRLKDTDAVIRVKQLEVGDFVLSDDVVVERKTVEDFLSSVVDGRLFSQLTMMSSNYSAPLIILEGNPQELFTLRNIHENAIRGILSSIALNYKIPILYASSEEETAKYLYTIAKREQLGSEKEIRLRVGRKGLTTAEQQQFVVEGFPLVGPSLAKALLKKFSNIRGIVNASIKELQEVEKMGPIKAKKLHEVLNANYAEK
ncbi:3'-flap repair endonuclease Xpf [uncultured archaeon]|nr:3'-flap repair endonuclease Xpf [uncultured archaeon]